MKPEDLAEWVVPAATILAGLWLAFRRAKALVAESTQKREVGHETIGAKLDAILGVLVAMNRTLESIDARTTRLESDNGKARRVRSS